MKTQTLELTLIHHEMLAKISANKSLIYYKHSHSKEQNKAVNDLVKAGMILKSLQRIQYQGRFSSRVTLTLNATAKY